MHFTTTFTNNTLYINLIYKIILFLFNFFTLAFQLIKDIDKFIYIYIIIIIIP